MHEACKKTVASATIKKLWRIIMIIQHNMPAMNAHRQLLSNNNTNTKALEKLSSGYRINRAGDDAAGLAISEKMRAQIRGLDMAGRNAQDGISLIQTAEGALNETHAILQRMRELSVQSANGIYDDEVDRTNLDKEVQRLKGEIDRISTSTNFNNIELLNGDLESKASVEVKAGADAGITEDIGSLSNGADFKAETYTVDLATIGIDFEKGIEHGEVFTISLETAGGSPITLTSKMVTDDAGLAGEDVIRRYDDISDIAALFDGTAFAIKADGTQSAGTGILAGDAVYEVSVVGSKLTFEHVGTATADAAGVFAPETIPTAPAGAAGPVVTPTTVANNTTTAAYDTWKATTDATGHTNADLLNEQTIDLGGDVKFDLNEDYSFEAGTTASTDIKFIDTTTTDLTGKIKLAQEGTNATRTSNTLTKASFDALNLRDGDSLTFYIEDSATPANTVEVTFDYVSSGAEPTVANDAGNGTFTTIEDLIRGINDLGALGMADADPTLLQAKAVGNDETGLVVTIGGNDAYGTDGFMEINHTSVKKAAESVITFDDGIRSGSTVVVNGITYEFVDEAENAIKGNEVIIVNALAGGASLTGSQAAKAFNDYLNTQNLIEFSNKIGQNAGEDDNKVTVYSLDKSEAADSADISVSAGGLTFQIGANGLSDQRVSLNINDMSTFGMGIEDISIASQDEANLAIDVLDDAINFVSSQRAELGALQNRLEHTISSLAVNEENLQAAESRIRDVDMAEEMMEFTKSNILSQAAQSMLAQANMQPQGILQLLQG